LTAVRVRFAPSPTGSLHLGNARTALFNWIVARQSKGSMVLRIEDTDVEREQEGSEAGIFEDLRWLGLDWDEGPDRGGPFGPYRQSERAEVYRRAAERLLAAGRAYRCFCTDEEIERERAEQREAPGRARYSGRCRRIPEGEAAARAASGATHAIRFRVLPDHPSLDDLSVVFEDRLRGRIEVQATELEDFVLLRRDGRATYNFAVVVDDAEMEITLVVRGDDHVSNTPRQVLLFRALGRPLPQFAHLPMVRGPDGERLSKRHGATSVSEYRRRGYTPAGLRNALALLGWSPKGDRPIVTLDEMLAEFDLDRVSKSPAIFDPEKLEWVSGQHIHRMDAAEHAAETARRLIEAGLLPGSAPESAPVWLAEVAEMLRSSLSRFEQVPSRAAAIFSPGIVEPTPEVTAELRQESARKVLAALALAIPALSDRPDAATWASVKARVQSEAVVKGKALFHPIRLVITGAASGPELDRVVPLIASGHRLFPDRIPSLLDRVRRAAGLQP
jgi:glutamyl-tRNA synthetase